MKRILYNTLSILTVGEKKKLGTFVMLNVCISIIDIASLALLVLLISFYTQEGLHINIPVQIKWLADRSSILPISAFILLFIAKSALGYWILALQNNYAYKVASRISRTNLLKYLEGAYSNYVHTDSSVLVRRILDQPIQFCHYILAGIQQMITELILSLFTIIIIFVFNAKLFLLLSLVLLPPVIIITWLTKRKLKHARANAKVTSERSLQYLHEALAGYIESNIYDKARFFTDRYAAYQQNMAKYLADIQTAQGVPARLIEVFAVLGLFVLILANKFMGNSSTIEIVNIGAFMAAAYKIIPGIVKISNITAQIKTYEYTITDLIEDKYVEKDPVKNKQDNIASISFRNINYNYQHRLILNNFNLEINKGDFAGVSGSSGAGKTTLINLLLGFLSQDGGDISVNNVKTTINDRQDYWRRIAYVQQRPFLINDTIAVNITLSEENNDGKKLNEVLQAVGLDDFIGHYPEGVNKIITENGKNISGGQRQRIALARALYKESDLIILDEPFSELDVVSEQKILKHIKKLSEDGKMIIMITHKSENLTYCNKIVFVG